jgi:hypothetical protein
MLKRLSIIGIISASLAACGSGGGSTNNRAPVNPNSAYGAVQGALVPLTGPLMNFYSIRGLQGVITTNMAVTSQLGNANVFGVCYGLDATPTGQALCNSNLTAISRNPSFSKVFPNPTVVNAGTFVVAGAQALGIQLVQPYRMLYTTAGAPYQFAGNATNTQTVSGAILVPETAPGVPLAANKIKGVVLYYHATILSKGGVPSDFYGDLTPNNTAASAQVNAITAFAQDADLAAVYASQGYVVVMPDYVGQGANYMVQHPYVLLAQTNAQSGLIALKAARNALAAQGIMLPNPANLYISSYSEGGAYAVWASRLAQISSSQNISGYPGYSDFLSDNGFNLRRTIGISGVYDLTGATLHYEFANANNSLDPALNTWNVSPGLIPGNQAPLNNPLVLAAAKVTAAFNLAASKTALAGYVLTGLAYYNSTSAAMSVLAPFYAPMNQCVNWSVSSSSGSYVTNGNVTPQSTFTNCPLALNAEALYNTSGLTQSQIADQSFAAATASAVGTNAYFTGGQTFNNLVVAIAQGYTNNSVGSFVEPGVINDQTITPFVSLANTQSFVTNSPIDLLFLNYDSTVSNINSLEACGNLPASAAFPGYQPNYQGGVKQLSAPGMVTCVNLANNGLGTLPQLFTQATASGVTIPIMVNHGQAEAALQILALNQILANP